MCTNLECAVGFGPKSNHVFCFGTRESGISHDNDTIQSFYRKSKKCGSALVWFVTKASVSIAISMDIWRDSKYIVVERYGQDTISTTPTLSTS